MLEAGRIGVENQYARAVQYKGNQPAQNIVQEVFQISNRQWRGIGEIPQSGLALGDKYAAYDASTRFGVDTITVEEPSACIAGDVMRGIKKPFECPLFGKTCNPERPAGAPMVSTEGACAAYYHYRRSA
jgi:hydrogenase expression/formation protein HypD